MAIVLPASFYNYDQGDNVLPAFAQLTVNLVLIFLAATTALWLSSSRPTAPDSQVLKYLSLALLLLGGVFVPAFFTLIWILWKVGLLTREATTQITFQHITGLSAVVSCVVAWLTYRRELRKAESADRRIVSP